MQTRPLGNTGSHISALGFGCMGLVGWYGTRNDDEARATLLAALDAGVTHFDTASSYQVGENERFVGASIRSRRDEVFLASKYGIKRDPSGGVLVDNKPDSLRSAVDSSLQRLGVAHIDLYYLHRIDRTVPIEESVGALSQLVAAGKIRHIGLSECSVNTLRRASKVHHIAAVQSEYSLWSREPEGGMLDACRELGTLFVAYSPLGRGFLAGNFKTLQDLPSDDARRTMPRFHDANAEHNHKIVTAVRDLAARKGCSAAQLAIAWVLAQGEHVTAIPGMKTRAHLEDNVGALNVTLTRAELDALRALVESHSVKGDRFPPAMMQAIDT
jgi:aryl-alcohol dehydrogenase-like predicted oxidoreductase